MTATVTTQAGEAKSFIASSMDTLIWPRQREEIKELAAAANLDHNSECRCFFNSPSVTIYDLSQEAAERFLAHLRSIRAG